VAKKFYDVLILHGYTDAYPWTGATTAAANDALANLGQLKNLFSFDLTRDSDGDGIPDWRETKFNLNPFNVQTDPTLPQPPPPAQLMIGAPNDWQGWTRIGRSDDLGVYGSGSTSPSALYDVYANQFYLNAASGTSNIPVGNQYVTGDPTGKFTYSPGAFTGENRILGIGVQGLPGSNVSGFWPTVKFALGDNTYSAATSVPGTDGRVSFSLYSHPGDFTVQFQPVEFGGSQILRPSNITFRGNDNKVYTLPGGIGSGASYDFAFRAIPLTSSNSYQMFFDLTKMQTFYSNVSLFQATFNRQNVLVAPGTNYNGQGIGTIGSKLTIAFNGLPNNTTVFCVDPPPLPPVEMRIASKAGATPDSDLLPSEQNLTPGGYVPINANNDNGSDIKKVDGIPTGFPEKRDFDADHLPKDDNELVRLKLSVPHSVPLTARVRIENTGRGRIKLWKDRRKNELFLADGQVDKPFADLPDELWVEGTKEGEVERETTIYLEIITGAKAVKGTKIKVTVTPVLKNYQSAAANSNEPVLGHDFYGRPVLVCGLFPAPPNPPSQNIIIRADILKTNAPGQPKQIQTVREVNPGGVAAKLKKNLGPIVRTFTFDFAPPNNGKQLVDIASISPPYTGFPYYGHETQETVGNTVSTWIGDTPTRPFIDIVLPKSDESFELDYSTYFIDTVVWEFPDGSAYPLGKTEWNIRWAGALWTLPKNEGEPLGFADYTWTPSANNHNNVSTTFTRDNTEPVLLLPSANQALKAQGGGYQ
jgi:hypothetical protein